MGDSVPELDGKEINDAEEERFTGKKGFLIQESQCCLFLEL